MEGYKKRPEETHNPKFTPVLPVQMLAAKRPKRQSKHPRIRNRQHNSQMQKLRTPKHTHTKTTGEHQQKIKNGTSITYSGRVFDNKVVG